MIIPMEPAQFLAGLKSGEYIRYGAIIKDATSGQIVGHLKEAGELSKLLSLSINSVGGALDVFSGVAANIQLAHITKMLEVLQMTATIGAAASVANLGVSAAGFAVVINKLNHIEAKLDSVVGKIDVIQSTLKTIGLKWDVMAMARIRAAGENLIAAENASTSLRRDEKLRRASATFQEMRHHFLLLISHLMPATEPSIGLDQAREIYARYFAAALGQIQTDFRLGDYGVYRTTLNAIRDEREAISSFEAVEVFRSRTDARELLDVYFDFEATKTNTQYLINNLTETNRRLEGYGVELDYLEANNIKPDEYLAELNAMEPNIVLIPHS